VIAAALRRAPSTISREVEANGGRERYRAAAADERAWQEALRPKEPKLALHIKLQRLVAEKLQMDWSPEQVSGWLRESYPDQTEMNVSHETIYKSLFIQARGVLKKELVRHLRSHRRIRRSTLSNTAGQKRGHIIDGISIRERPAEAEDRALPGHWEGDLLAGTVNSHIATLVERRSRYVMLVKVPGKDAASVSKALVKHVHQLPLELRKSLTWDRGPEIAHHKAFTLATNLKVYLCDPQSPWQRGSNENTNGLLRQYFPKGISVAGFTQAELNAVARRLNERPRKTLGFKTPADMFNQTVAVTG
jgi:IS30 family transposase